MLFFTPRYLKNAKHLEQAAKKVVRYKRDILRPEAVAEMEKAIAALRDARRRRDRKAMEKASANVERVCETHVPTPSHAAWRENIEIIVVAFVVAAGIRAYFLQPFKIPTGSMQPTLYGMVGTVTKTPHPNPILRAVQFVWIGRSYLDVAAKQTEQVVDLRERTVLNFFTFTDILTDRGSYSVFSPRDVLYRDFGVQPRRVYQKGEKIAYGWVDSGDHVFVDKMSYNFVHPKLADVFVFKTTGIREIERGIDFTQYYIKRLAGLPGDTLRIDPPLLYINGKAAQQPAFQRVMSLKNGYRGYSNNPEGGKPLQYLGNPNASFTVPPDCYFALGDNSFNSSDSRNWGIVPEENVNGRGFLVYWPFTKRWGLVR